MAAIVWASLDGRSMAAKARYALAASVMASASMDTVSKDMGVSGLEAMAARFSDAQRHPGRT